MIQVHRLPLRLTADPTRRTLRRLSFGGSERLRFVWQYLRQQSDEQINSELSGVMALFEKRHTGLPETLIRRGEKLLYDAGLAGGNSKLTTLLGAYFCHEYTIESAALFNPSIVMHPQQDKEAEGKTRFVLSLRATGEGHISSIAFQEGYVSASGDIELIDRPACADTGEIVEEHDSSYRVVFSAEVPLGGRLLFPYSPKESNGMEDARFVRIEGCESLYAATYTAYNGRQIQPHLILTDDFCHFSIRPLEGKVASDKGMALFPEKIGNRFAMVGRQGGRHLTYMTSDNLQCWDHCQDLQYPSRGWEMMQMGNCGSPVKTREGWLLLTHAVGPMRRYVLSMTLLDGDDPSRVIGSLEQPLMEPLRREREGYVPNVLYTCGMMPLKDQLFIPYAMSDSAIGFAMVNTDDVIKAIKK